MIGGLPLPGLGAMSAAPQGPSSGAAPPPATSGCSTPEQASGPGRAAGRATGDHDEGPRFDRMLDDGSADAAPAATTTPADTAAEPADKTDTDAAPASGSDPAAASPASLPDQMLALLAGLPPAAPAAAAPTPPTDAAIAQAGASPVPATAIPGALPSLAATAPGAGPLVAAPASDPSTAAADAPAFALPALLAERDSDAAAPADASGLPSFTELASLAAAPGMPTTGPHQTTVATAPLTVALPIDPLAGLDEAFGGNLLWMADQKLGQAEIRVTPENMGPIDVRLQVDGTRVRAEFFSAQPEVRQALESSMVRLRDMLGQHGLQLAHADVGHRQSQAQGSASTGPGRSDDAPDDLDARPLAAGPILRGRGLLDEYA